VHEVHTVSKFGTSFHMNYMGENFVLPECSCYPYRVYSPTVRSAVFHLWLALLSH